MLEQCSKSDDAIRQKQIVEREYRNFFKTNKCTIRDILDPTFLASNQFRTSGTQELWNQLADFITIQLTNSGAHLFLFDQIERLFHLMKADAGQITSTLNGYHVYFFTNLIRLLRELDEVRTLFIIRAEYLYQSFDFLQNATLREGDVKHVRLTHFLCPGINTVSSPQATKLIDQTFSSIPGAEDYAHAFETITGLNSRELSNTFGDYPLDTRISLE